MKRRHSRLEEKYLIHFVTTTIVQWIPVFEVAEIANHTLRLFEKYRSAASVPCLGYVLMPHHFHAMLEGEGISRVMMNFKKASSVFIADFAEQKGRRDWLAAFCREGETHHAGRPRVQVWQDRYDDVPCYSPYVIHSKLDYIHSNPVRAGLVDKRIEYAYSSECDFHDKPNPWIRVEKSRVPALLTW